MNALLSLAADKEVVVFVGSGGVGKTTLAAAFGLQAARSGKRTLVLTIDPAKRLANALGLQEFGNDATPVDLSQLMSTGEGWGEGAPVQGSLSAMMLDTKRTFDDMVREYLPDLEAQEKLGKNRIYRSFSEALAGVQEYMAVSKLYDIVAEDEYDLVILDTPPTSHALDFLDAPQRFLDFLNHDALQWLLKSGLRAGRQAARLFDVGTGFLLKTLGRIAGLDILREIAEFVSAFEPLLHGFRERAENVTALLNSPALGFVVVTAPTATQIAEARSFSRKLQQQEFGLIATIVNRSHPPLSLQSLDVEAIMPLVGDRAVVEAAVAAGQSYNLLANGEAAEMARLTDPVFSAVELTEDVHSLSSLARLAQALSAR